MMILSSSLFSILASSRENLSLGVCEQQRRRQPAHWPSLISPFVIRFLESIISRLATSEISVLLAGLCS